MLRIIKKNKNRISGAYFEKIRNIRNSFAHNKFRYDRKGFYYTDEKENEVFMAYEEINDFIITLGIRYIRDIKK